MLARRRDVLYKRSQNLAAHLGIAARAAPSQQKIPDTSAVPSGLADSSSSGPIALTPATPTQKTTDTPTPSSPAATPNVPTQSTASAASSSSSPSSASAAATSSKPTSSLTASSATATAVSPVSTPLSAAPPTTANVPSYTAQGVTGVSLAPSTLSPSATSSTGSSSGTNTGAIVGGIAGTLAGVAVLGFLLMWCMRRQRTRDVDDFDAQAFKRQSAILVDDPVEPSRSYNPRPPTMIERHNASPALAAQAGYGTQNFYGSYGGYNQESPYPPPEMIRPAGSPPPQAYGAPPMGYAGYNDPQQRVVRQPSNVEHAYDVQQQLARQPSHAGYLTRQPNSAVRYGAPAAPPASFDPNAQYIDLNRSSISPYQAAQYADISRQLGAAEANADVPHEPLDIPDDPLPSPFDDPVQPPLAHHVAAPGPVITTPAQKTVHERPDTLYEVADAYGGI